MNGIDMYNAIAKVEDGIIDRAYRSCSAEAVEKRKKKGGILKASVVSALCVTIAAGAAIGASLYENKPTVSTPPEQTVPGGRVDQDPKPIDQITASTPEELAVKDLTVEFDPFDAEAFPNVIDSGSATDFAVIYTDLSSLRASSTNVVYGMVESVNYWDLSGAANTIYTFKVCEVIKGDLPENALISVITAGGYYRLRSYVNVFGKGKYRDYSESEIDQTVIHHSFAGVIDVPTIGDKYLLFLSGPTQNENPFPDGLYCEVGAFMGRLIEQNDGTFRRVVPKNEPNFYGSAPLVYTKAEVLAQGN